MATSLQPGAESSVETIKGTNIEAKANIVTGINGDPDVLESNLTFSTAEELNNMTITCQLSGLRSMVTWEIGPATLTVLGKPDSSEVQ